jgi:general secretion pathway protein A
LIVSGMSETTPASLPDPPAFGLRQEPFDDTADDAFFFPSDQHLRALEFMGHSLWTRARLGVVTADAGCGKSFLIRRLLKDLDERIVAAAVQREHIGPKEFLLEILRQFGFTLDENDKTDRRRLLERFLVHQAGMGRICLLVVENAQNMHPSVLEELRCLAAVQAEGARILKVLLLGQPSLNLVLDSPRMAELVAGSVPRYSLGPLSEDQTAAYVAHRLRAAGAPDPDMLMPHTLMSQIHACTGGVPAKINRLCSAALACLREEGGPALSPQNLDRAIAKLGWTGKKLAPVVEAKPLPAAGPAAHTQGKLVITMQGLPDREIPLNGDRLLLGRGEEADVRIDSVFISRYHALIVRDAGQYLMLDLGSTNGLLVNSRRILRRALRHRDLIQVGPARVVYLNEQALASPHLDPGETICFARPGFPAAAGEESPGTLLAFGRLDTSG